MMSSSFISQKILNIKVTFKCYNRHLSSPLIFSSCVNFGFLDTRFDELRNFLFSSSSTDGNFGFGCPILKSTTAKVLLGFIAMIEIDEEIQVGCATCGTLLVWTRFAYSLFDSNQAASSMLSLCFFQFHS